MTEIPEELLRAYRQTEYRAHSPFGTLTIKVDEVCPALDSLLRRHQARTWAFITAWNPNSQKRDLTANLGAQRELMKELEAAGAIVFEGSAEDPSGCWPTEPSLLALGVSEGFARDLASRFSQNGFIYGEFGSPARLALTV